MEVLIELTVSLKWLKSLFKNKKEFAIMPGQVDVIQGCDPSKSWVIGMMPSMSIPELIEHLDFRKSIHETYYGLVVSGNFSPYSGYGDANFHLWAIEGYENAIHYLEGLVSGTHTEASTSF